MFKYQCPKCDWIGSEDELIDSRDDEGFGYGYSCPSCGFGFAVDQRNPEEDLKEYSIEEDIDIRESLTRSLQQAKAGQLLPIERLWDGIE